MAEETVPATAPPDASGATPPPSVPSAGYLLREAREAAGIHLGALAAALKVPVAKLSALESDRIDLLPDAVFARALAATVCRTLKIDAAPVLALLPGRHKPSLEIAARVAPTAFQERPMTLAHPAMSKVSRISKPVLWGAALLIVAALLLLVIPNPVRGPGSSSNDSDAAGTASATTGAGMVVSPVTPAVPATSAAAAPAAVAAPAPGVSEPVPTTPSAAEASANAQLINFTAHGGTWVQVTDARGTVLLRKTLAGGESVGATGELPLSVVIGKVDQLQVQVRGKPFDLAPLSRDNVARFQVK